MPSLTWGLFGYQFGFSHHTSCFSRSYVSLQSLISFSTHSRPSSDMCFHPISCGAVYFRRKYSLKAPSMKAFTTSKAAHDPASLADFTSSGSKLAERFRSFMSLRPILVSSDVASTPSDFWHCRHCSVHVMNLLGNSGIKGISLATIDSSTDHCSACQLSKHTRNPFPNSMSKTLSPTPEIDVRVIIE